MPNWSHIAVHSIYHLGLALWIGGGVALGALTAPELFRRLPRQEAGAIFGRTLRKFARLRLGAAVAVIGAAAVQYLVWEAHTAGVWIAVRWTAIAVMAAAILYEIGYLERAIEQRRQDLTPEQPDDDPARQAFQRLHRRAEALMKLSLAAAVVALVLS